MSIALRVVWEVYGGKFAPLTGEVVELRPRKPAKCARKIRLRVASLKDRSGAPGVAADLAAIRRRCAACGMCKLG